MGAVGALLSRSLWLDFLGFTALTEGVYGFTGTHCSCSRLNSIIHMTDLQ